MLHSEVISRLIFLAFIAAPEPVPIRDDGKAMLSWNDAMALYADAILQEAEAAKHAEAEARPADSEGGATIPTNDGGDVAPSVPAEKPPPFTGVGAGEKQAIHKRLLEFCRARPGVSGKLAKATNGVLETTQIYDMRESRKFNIAQWRAVNAAMDWIERQEANTI